jgi:hypothetical protein
MKQWNDIKSEFEPDGSLRDILIQNIEPTLWDTFIAEVKRSKYKLEFSHGDIMQQLPNNLATIKSMQEINSTTLHIWVGDNIKVSCHFFIETEIELDVSPYDIQAECSYIHLIGFLEWLATMLKSEVKLTHEGMQEQVILSISL